jgi:hypothetical protein
LSSQSELWRPPPPAKFNKSQTGAARASISRSTPKLDASETRFIRSVKKNISEAILVHELCSNRDESQDDLWKAVDNIFLQ